MPKLPIRVLGFMTLTCCLYSPQTGASPQTDTAKSQARDTRLTASALNTRGMAKFRAGDIAGSIVDFDAAIQRQPGLEKSHWQRGISYYYAGAFELGAKQFEMYQTYDAADVENVVWRFLCQAAAGKHTDEAIAKARADMLPLSARDRRIPMMEIDALFRGTGSVKAVFAAAQAGDPDAKTRHYRMFYANLYVGLFYEATKGPNKSGNHESGNHESGNHKSVNHESRNHESRNHIVAADKLRIHHYMWDVAHVHAERLRQNAEPVKHDH